MCNIGACMSVSVRDSDESKARLRSSSLRLDDALVGTRLSEFLGRSMREVMGLGGPKGSIRGLDDFCA